MVGAVNETNKPNVFHKFQFLIRLCYHTEKDESSGIRRFWRGFMKPTRLGARKRRERETPRYQATRVSSGQCAGGHGSAVSATRNGAESAIAER